MLLRMNVFCVTFDQESEKSLKIKIEARILIKTTIAMI